MKIDTNKVKVALDPDINRLSKILENLHKEAEELAQITGFEQTGRVELDHIKEATYELEKAAGQINQLKSYICYIMQIPISRNDQ